MFNLKRRLLKELLIMKLEKQNGILDFLQQNRTEIKITCKMYVCVCVCVCVLTSAICSYAKKN